MKLHTPCVFAGHPEVMRVTSNIKSSSDIIFVVFVVLLTLGANQARAERPASAVNVATQHTQLIDIAPPPIIDPWAVAPPPLINPWAKRASVKRVKVRAKRSRAAKRDRRHQFRRGR